MAVNCSDCKWNLKRMGYCTKHDVYTWDPFTQTGLFFGCEEHEQIDYVSWEEKINDQEKKRAKLEPTD